MLVLAIILNASISLTAALQQRQTWWVDKSCVSYWDDARIENESMVSAKFDSMMEEMTATVEMGAFRMSFNGEDEPQAHRIYHEIFKNRPRPGDGDDIGQIPWAAFSESFWGGKGSIQHFEKEPLTNDHGRKASEVRIYCDEDARFKLVPDGEEQYPEYGKNSERGPEFKEWEDTINKIRANGRLGCSIPRTFATTSGGRAGPGTDDPDHENNWRRTSITLCERFWKRKSRIDRLANVDALHPDKLKDVGSMLILHEFHHHSRYGRVDYCIEWDGCLALDNVHAMANVGNYVFFGIMMQLLERQLV